MIPTLILTLTHVAPTPACTSAGGSGGGLLNNLRQLLWVPIDQRAYKRVSLDVFAHLLDLDLDYHLHRKTGTGPKANLRL